MAELTDHELLAEFAKSESEEAFAALVARYVNLVYSTALRFTANTHSAEEITQAVFIILARKAGGLSPRVVLSGWLYQTARLTAANFVKGEMRRQRREQEAHMQSILNEPDAVAWEQIAPLLDEAMGRLGETDRNAVLLRFFQNKTAGEVAAALQLSEAAALKRTSRALEKLRKFLAKNGVSSTGAIISGAISVYSVQTAPLALAKSATAVAIAKGVAASASTLTLVKGTMKGMTRLKMQFAIGVAAVALLAGGAAILAMSQRNQVDNLTPTEILNHAENAYAALSSYRDEGQTVVVVDGNTLTSTFTIKLARPNLYRIEWNRPGSVSKVVREIVWSTGSGDFLIRGNRQAVRLPDTESALGISSSLSAGAARTAPAPFFKFNREGGTMYSSGMSANHTRQPDEKVGGVDCYVLTREFMGTTITLWIGKKDFLIRQKRTVSNTEALKASSDLVTKVTGHPQPPPAQSITETETHSNIVVNERFSPGDFAASQ